jgi:hypothetical protein
MEGNRLSGNQPQRLCRVMADGPLFGCAPFRSRSPDRAERTFRQPPSDSAISAALFRQRKTGVQGTPIDGAT